MKILVVGDIMGKPGRNILGKYLGKNLGNYDFVVVNGENSAGGFGITEKVADEFFSFGVDAITSGNHIWDKRDIYRYLENEERLLRPLNYPVGVPGRGYTILEAKNGEKIAVVNIQGRVFMMEVDSPFQRIEEILPEILSETKNIIVDFHAEASSEKIAMGWFLDGQVSVLYGTHTHVLTADNRILTKGTGYLTDAGMTGGFDGCIGMKKDSVLGKFLNSLPTRFEVCDENVRLNGFEAEIDSETGKCLSIDLINIGVDEI